jgi:hypothetical protein
VDVIKILIRITSAITVIFLFACTDESEPLENEPAEGVGGGPGGVPPEDATEVPGEYIPPSASEQAQAKFEAAVAVQEGKPIFEGEVNGFRLVRSNSDGSADLTPLCQATHFEPSDVLAFGYLPPGTAPVSQQSAAICPNGEVLFHNQEFLYEYGSIGVTLLYGEKAVISLSPEDRVKPVDVHGQLGVFEEPLIPEGNGYSKLAFALGGGHVVMEVTGLPADETIKIAEGISCRDC